MGTAFAIGPNVFVSAGHVLLSAVGSQFGAPALRDSAGHVHPIDKILKFSRHEDFIVFTVADANAAEPPLDRNEYELAIAEFDRAIDIDPLSS